MGASNVYRRRFYSYIPRLTMPATPRFKINDSVNKKRTSGMYTEIGPSVGKIVEMRVKENKKGTPGYYCTVKWPDGRTSEHAQHMLTPAP